MNETEDGDKRRFRRNAAGAWLKIEIVLEFHAHKNGVCQKKDKINLYLWLQPQDDVVARRSAAGRVITVKDGGTVMGRWNSTPSFTYCNTASTLCCTDGLFVLTL